jgi:preprotein translocase subunit YajC
MKLRSLDIIAAVFIGLGSTAGAAITYAPSASITPGMQVVDVAGNLVGTVKSIRGQELILATDRHEVRLPLSSFAPSKGKLLFGMSREALNQATDAMYAKALLPGSDVYGKNGSLAGRIEAINEQFVTIELQSGESIRLPRDSVGPGSKGAVLGVTVAEFQEMVKQTLSQTP